MLASVIPLSGFSNTAFQESDCMAFRRELSGSEVFFQTDQRESDWALADEQINRRQPINREENVRLTMRILPRVSGYLGRPQETNGDRQLERRISGLSSMRIPPVST